MKPSLRCERDAELIRDFRDAYVDLLNSATMHQDYFDRSLVPAVDHVTWQIKRRQVAGAAGVAADAYARHGGTFTLRNAAYITRNVSPVVNWELSLADPEQLSPETVMSAVDAAEASARLAALDARNREKGLMGLIAAFLRWPSDLREAVGPGHPAQRTAAGAIGLLAQILVAAVATAMGTGIVAGAAALWQWAL